MRARWSMERAVRALIRRDFEHVAGHPERVGGDLPSAVTDVYVRIGRVGSGDVDRIQGNTVLDLEVYANTYNRADSAAFDLEALVLGYPHVVEVDGRTVVIDKVEHNGGPQSLPWEDDRITRLGSTYTFIARRH